MLHTALSGTNASTNFTSKIVKIKIYPMTFDKVLQWLSLRKCTVKTIRLSSASGHANNNEIVIKILISMIVIRMI